LVGVNLVPSGKSNNWKIYCSNGIILIHNHITIYVKFKELTSLA
jgi:hypothetical protein